MLKYWLLEPLVPVPVVNTNDTHPHAPSSVLEIFDTPPDDGDLFEKDLKRITRCGGQASG